MMRNGAAMRLSCTLFGFLMCAKRSAACGRESSKAGTMFRWTIYGGDFVEAFNTCSMTTRLWLNRWALWDNSSPPATLLANSSTHGIVDLRKFLTKE